jgi:hypothetical protein
MHNSALRRYCAAPVDSPFTRRSGRGGGFGFLSCVSAGRVAGQGGPPLSGIPAVVCWMLVCAVLVYMR